jgi:hypothetical protein
MGGITINRTNPTVPQLNNSGNRIVPFKRAPSGDKIPPSSANQNPGGNRTPNPQTWQSQSGRFSEVGPGAAIGTTSDSYFNFVWDLVLQLNGPGSTSYGKQPQLPTGLKLTWTDLSFYRDVINGNNQGDLSPKQWTAFLRIKNELARFVEGNPSAKAALSQKTRPVFNGVNVSQLASTNNPTPRDDWQKVVGEGVFGLGQGELTAANVKKIVSKKLNKMERRDNAPEGKRCVLVSSATASRANGRVTVVKEATVIPLQTVGGREVVDPNALAVSEVTGRSNTEIKRTRERLNGSIAKTTSVSFGVDRDKMPGDGRHASFEAQRIREAPIPVARTVAFGNQSNTTVSVSANPISLDKMLSGTTTIQLRNQARGSHGYFSQSMQITPNNLNRADVNRVALEAKTELTSSGGCVYVENGVPFLVPARESGSKDKRGVNANQANIVDTPTANIAVSESTIIGRDGDRTKDVRSSVLRNGPAFRSE